MSSLGNLLAETAMSRPDAVAVSGRGGDLTYAELLRKSTELAELLRDAGVGPGDRVAVHLAKTAAAVTAVHGVLASGAAYVPLDPLAPRARILRLLADCAPRALVTDHEQAEALGGLPTGGPVQLIVEAAGSAGVRPDEPWWGLRPSATAAGPLPERGAADTAYILYTSGSTGAPKGVVHRHDSALAFVTWAHREFGVGPDDRILSLAPLHFDLSTFDLYVTALAGAALHLAPASALALPAALVAEVARSRATVMYGVPTLFARLTGASNAAALTESCLRRVLFAGEVFPTASLRAFDALLPKGTSLHNLYGPTETNVCTAHRVTADDLAPGRRLPIPLGEACPYASLSLVDPSGHVGELRPGRRGELRIGGASVMLGYWPGPDVRAEPAAREPVHDSGDLVEVSADGRLVYLGRRDRMVKLRGHRVEPGEVEAALAEHPAVTEAAVVVAADPHDPSAQPSLHAFTAVADPGADEQELLAHCLGVLPSAMVPHSIRVLDGLPVTSTGKVDLTLLERLAASAEPGASELREHRERVTTRPSRPHEYRVEVGGTLDGFNTADYLAAGNDKNMREQPRFEPNRHLVLANVGRRDVVNPRLVVDGRRDWHSVDTILASVLRPEMTDREKAYALYVFTSRIDVQAHNNYLRVDEFLPDPDTAPGFNTFRERADPVKALNSYYCSGCALSAANLVVLARRAGLEARAVFAGPLEGPYEQHCGVEIRYEGDYHFFDPEARVFFLRKDNETVASYQDIHRHPELVVRTHSHGFAAQECRAAFVQHYRNHFPPYEVPVEDWAHRMDLRLRPGERLIHSWDHRGKFRYGRNPRATPGPPYRLANSALVYRPDLSEESHRRGFAARLNIVEAARGPWLRPVVAGAWASVTVKVESPYPIVGGRAEADFTLTPGAAARVSVCLGPPPWHTVWEAEAEGAGGPTAAAADLDAVIDALHREAVYAYHVKFAFRAPPETDPETVGLDRLAVETDLQTSTTSLPALAAGTNTVRYQDESPDGSDVLLVHGWTEDASATPPAPPGAPVFPADGAVVPIADLRHLRWRSGDCGTEIADHHIHVSTREDALLPVSPNFDRLTFGPAAEWPVPRSFLRPGTRYFWRLRARSAHGVWSEWTAPWSFTVE